MKPHPILSTSFLSGYRNNPPLFITLKSNFSFKSHGILSLSPVITSCSLSLPSAIFSLKPRSVIKFAPRLTRLLCSSVLAHQATATLNPELAALPHDLIQQGPKLVFRTTRREGAKTVFRWATRAASRDRIKGEKSQEIESISASAASRGLCGDPLIVTCPGGEDSDKGRILENDNGGGEDDVIDKCFYMSLGLGFAAGILVPFFILVIRKSWCDAYFHFVDEVLERIHECLI